MTDPEAIAKGLTAEMAHAILLGGGSHEIVTSPEVENLWFEIAKSGSGHFSISLTPLGQQVRAILESNHG